ncbi:MAG: hypothetical protein JEY94_06710 [Melioribacteraceae bacterium]|nr:hypothetical protein [Melioribacteraceae bacterium]
MKKLQIRDLTLRDGQQSLFATRMKQEQVDRVLGFYKEAGFYAMEVWGGAVPDSIMRFLGENPWTRLEKIKSEIGEVSKLTALSRGRNLFGYNPYPEEVIEGFNKNAVQSGIGIMRIFDCLNDVDNMKSTIKYVKQYGGMADCAVCYTVDPKFSRRDKAKAVLAGKKLPKKLFDIDYFLNKAKQMEKLGADIISVKDMAGLITPSQTGKIIKRLKSEINVPIDFHTHCTPGYGLASVLMAIINGVDIVDTNMMNFAGGSAAPAFEIVQIFADKLNLDTGVNLDSVYEINSELKLIREELAEHDSYKQFPIEFDIRNYKLPEEINYLFDKAILFAKCDSEDELLETIHKIEDYFNFVAPNEKVKNAEIPGGMYTNMLSQLKQLKLDHLLDRVLEVVPKVRLDAGIPPLVTPSSQIVGAQAVNCVISENKKEPFYSNVSTQFHNLVKGFYGKTPVEIDPKFRKQICGISEETPFDTSNYIKQDNPVLEEIGGVKLAENEKEELLLELFPSVAIGFLKKVKTDEFNRKLEEEILEKEEKYNRERAEYNKLSFEEKMNKIESGLQMYAVLA